MKPGLIIPMHDGSRQVIEGGMKFKSAVFDIFIKRIDLISKTIEIEYIKRGTIGYSSFKTMAFTEIARRVQNGRWSLVRNSAGSVASVPTKKPVSYLVPETENKNETPKWKCQSTWDAWAEYDTKYGDW